MHQSEGAVLQAKDSHPKISKGLTINQRNLLTYYLNHKKKYKNVPCYVPRIFTQSSRLPDYLQALSRLEELKLIRIDRTASNYTGWIMLDPK